MEFLQANWFWIVLGLGAVWLLFARGGMGCGTGDHRSRGSRTSSETGHGPTDDGARGGPPATTDVKREPQATGAHRHGGC